MTELPDLADIKSYLFNHVQTPKVFDLFPKNEVHEGLTDEQAFQLTIALLAAEESAEIIGESVRRAAIISSRTASTTYTEPVPIQTDTGVVSTYSVPIRVTRQNELKAQNIVAGGTLRFIDLSGIGALHEFYAASPNTDFGVSVYGDGNLLYEGNYTSLGVHSVADSHLDVYQDTDSDSYYIVINDVKFRDTLEIFVNNTGTSDIEFVIIRANYEMQE
ncbi:MAG: hypothetical protein ACTSPB_17185 [Candidatus Thorarchaeota archaeon]